MRMTWRGTLNSDPWRDIAPPNASSAVNGRRVDAEGRWDFFWARDLDRRPLLVLRFSCETPAVRLPKPKGIEVALHGGDGQHDSMLTLTLLEAEHRDIFYRLCTDIIAASSGATSEAEALAVTIARTWRWHHLLRGGRDARLSSEEQKGLIGELLVLERHLLGAMPATDAVASWTGPLGAPKDFEIGAICVEAKARRGAATPAVAISSEHQLDSRGSEALFLHVTDLARGAVDASGSFSVSDVAQRVASRVADLDPGATEPLDSLLAAAGLRWDDDYSDCLWTEISTRLYEVRDDFPRLTSSGVPSGVSHVKYSISLADCEPYLVDVDRLKSLLEGTANGS